MGVAEGECAQTTTPSRHTLITHIQCTHYSDVWQYIAALLGLSPPPPVTIVTQICSRSYPLWRQLAEHWLPPPQKQVNSGA